MMRALQQLLQPKEQKVVVKHTFIEVVEDQANGQAPGGSRPRYFSDSVLNGSSMPEIENLRLRSRRNAEASASSTGPHHRDEVDESRVEERSQETESPRSGLPPAAAAEAAEVLEPGPREDAQEAGEAEEPPCSSWRTLSSVNQEALGDHPEFFVRTFSSFAPAEEHPADPPGCSLRTLSSLNSLPEHPVEPPGCAWRTLSSLDSLPSAGLGSSGSNSSGAAAAVGSSTVFGGAPLGGAQRGGQGQPAGKPLPRQQPPAAAAAAMAPQPRRPPPQQPRAPAPAPSSNGSSAFARVVRAAAPLRARQPGSKDGEAGAPGEGGPPAPAPRPSSALLPTLLGRFCAAAASASAASSKAHGALEAAGPGEEARGSGAAPDAAASTAKPAPVKSKSAPSGTEQRTTVMLRNLPNNYSRAHLLAHLDEEGLEGQYDFVYLPIDFRTGAALGYAFVNMVSPDAVPPLWEALDGFSRWALPSRKVCSVGWSDPHQGLEENIERYRNSPVMHPSVPDSHKPIVFSGGERVDFPPATKTLRAPRVRRHLEEKRGH